MDRLKLKQKLIQQCLDAGVRFHRGRAAGCHHGTKRSTLECQDGVEVTAQVVVDATGHSRRLTEMDGKHDPGYQAAYGVMAGANPSPLPPLPSSLITAGSRGLLPAGPSLHAHVPG